MKDLLIYISESFFLYNEAYSSKIQEISIQLFLTNYLLVKKLIAIKMFW